MRITAKISHYHKGIFALFLFPFLWLEMYFHELERHLSKIIYDEIFDLELPPTSKLTHFIRFCIFSALCLLTYYENLEEYIAFFLYGLWGINYFSVKFKMGLYIDQPVRMRLEKRGNDWEWCIISKGRIQQQERFNARDVKRVLIAAETYGDDSFRNQVLQIWHVLIEAKNGKKWVVHQESDIQKSLTKAVNLAECFNSQVVIYESYGTGGFADMDLDPQSTTVLGWEKEYIGNNIDIYKSFSSLSFLRWFILILKEVGYFIFIAILAGIMERYGTLLMILFWDDLGFSKPQDIVINFNSSWFLDFFMPNFNWVLMLVFGVTFIVLLHSIYRQSRKHQIIIKQHRIEYRISGEIKKQLSFGGQLDIVVLKGFDKTSLIILNEEHQLLEIKGLEEDEYDELYEILLTLQEYDIRTYS